MQFLRKALTPQAVVDVLSRAVAQLDGQPEHTLADQVLSDATALASVLASRCEELPRILGRTHEPGDSMEWSV